MTPRAPDVGARARAMFTRDGNPNDDRGPSMMVRHAEARKREAALNAERFLREQFPEATPATLALALKEHDDDVALAKDALKEFFASERAGRDGRSRKRDRREKRERGGSDDDDDDDSDGRRRRRRRRDKKRHKKHGKHRKRSRSRSRSRSRDRERKRPDERARRGDNAERRREEEEREAREARQREIVARLRAQGDLGSHMGALREQEMLRHKLQVAHRVGDTREVDRIKALLGE